jgi:ssDNA-binding Zn-finger/Zn-ribbon topoisomerase 1
VKGNKEHIKCKECKGELDTLPVNKEQSSLICDNFKCLQFARIQLVINTDNSKFFATPKTNVKGYYLTSSFHKTTQRRTAKYSE